MKSPSECSKKTICGLELLQAYNDEDKDDDDDGREKILAPTPSLDCINEPLRKRQKLHVPDVVQNMFKSLADENNQTDPDLYKGRIRNFPHERGNWSSYAFISFEGNELLGKLTKKIQLMAKNFPDKSIEFNEDAELHLSLSKTLTFRHHWIEPFIETLKTKIKKHPRFDIHLENPEVYINESKSRTFIGSKVYSSSSLLFLIGDIDKCLAEYNLETFYKEPSFHVSLAWIVGDHFEWTKSELLPLITSKWNEICDTDSDAQFQIFSINKIIFKIGNKIYELYLSDSK